MANMISAMGQGTVSGDLEHPLTLLQTVASVYQKLTPRGSITKGQELTLKSDLCKHATTVANKKQL